jgi:hypothetical protein
MTNPANNLVNADGSLSGHNIMLAAHADVRATLAAVERLNARYPVGHKLRSPSAPYAKLLASALRNMWERAYTCQKLGYKAAA